MVYDQDPMEDLRIEMTNDPTINYNTTVKRVLEITTDKKKVKLEQKVNNTFMVYVDGGMVELPYNKVPKITKVLFLIRLIITLESNCCTSPVEVYIL